MQLEFNLSHPHFTWLHNAGLAGLWMTLKQLDKEISGEMRPGNLRWKLEKRRVKMEWEGKDYDVLHWLLNESFEIYHGLISLRGINSRTMPIASQVILHQGILGTFLQHNQTHKSTGVVSRSFTLDEDEPEMIVTYKFLTSYIYQNFAEKLCDSSGNLLKTPINVPGWLNPGAVVRHVAFSNDTSFQELPELALILLFAPVACYYYLLRSELRDKRAQYALVIPQITNLETFAKWRQHPVRREVGYKDFFSYGLGDAGLRLLTNQRIAKSADKSQIKGCQVLTLGTVPWSTQQKTRTDLYVITAKPKICKNYQTCSDLFTDKVVKGKDGAFVPKSFIRELIAENLAKSQPWFQGISEKANTQELFTRLTYERGQLNEMIKRVEWDEKKQELFVKSFHDALGMIYGQINEQVKNKGGKKDFQDAVRNSLIHRETIRIRSDLMRCRNAEAFREFIVRFFSKAGRVSKLQNHWSELLKMVIGSGDWKLTRDLALLALASYKGKERKSEESEKEVEEEESEFDPMDIDID
jgi:CRISPR-associated protein Cas8a1/Csx13